MPGKPPAARPGEHAPGCGRASEVLGQPSECLSTAITAVQPGRVAHPPVPGMEVYEAVAHIRVIVLW